jgi:hypothetical protein
VAQRPAETIRISISDTVSDENKVKQLYQAVLRIKKADSGEAAISYGQFVNYIANKTRSIREKSGCTAVAFTLALDEDAIRFTAAPDGG